MTKTKPIAGSKGAPPAPADAYEEAFDPDFDASGKPPRTIKLFGREFRVPQSRLARIIIGFALCLFGVFGFLPVLGFWMLPLGLLILSYDFAWARRLRRRLIVWWERRRKPAARADGSK